MISRTEVDRWAEWSKINIASDFTVPVFWRVVRTKAVDKDIAAIHKAVATLEAKLAIANALLETRAYIAGDMLTLADIQFGHVLFRYFDIEITRSYLPALAAYYDRLKARPTYAKHIMVPYDELRVG